MMALDSAAPGEGGRSSGENGETTPTPASDGRFQEEEAGGEPEIHVDASPGAERTFLQGGCPASEWSPSSPVDELDPDEVSEIKALLPTLRRLQAEKGSGGTSVVRRSKRGWIDGIGDDNDSSSAGSDDSDDDFIRLSRDTFSLLYASGPRTAPFLFALGVFAFQMLILILVFVDSTTPGSDNPLEIPAGVSIVVRTAQFTAVVVAVATQSDLIAALDTVYEGYPGIGWIEHDYGGSWWQWVFSAACRFAEGGLCLVATWVLIVQSSGVVDLFLDFLAMVFVSELDDIAFGLARDGYLSGSLKRETKHVSNARIPSRRAKHYCFRQTLFGVVFLGLVAGWAIIVHQQNAGAYQSCTCILMQFGDSFDPHLAYFSGLYELQADVKNGGRVTYFENGNGQYHGRGMIAYCPDEGAWTFSYAEAEGTTPNPCVWKAKADSDEYDVMDIPPSDWNVLGIESSEEKPFLHFSYECIDCGGDRTEIALCSESGTCVDNRCVCNEGFYGLRCEFDEPCHSEEVDTSAQGFPGHPQRYAILHHAGGAKAFAYGRPVYVANATRDDGGPFDFIAFTGRRWMLSSSATFDRKVKDGIRTTADLADYLSADFHARWSTFKAFYGSAPMDMNTPEDSLTPTNLAWYRVTKAHNGPDLTRPLPTLLLCSECSDELNPCSHDGVCENGTCRCPYGTFGALCQLSDFQLCRSVAVQYGDEVRASLGSFAGAFDTDENRTLDGRAVYYERNGGRSMLAYCEEEEAWVFTPAWYPGNGTVAADGDGGEHCAGWVAMSSLTNSYDVTASTDWVVRRNDDADEGVPLLYMSLRCGDCDPLDRRSCGVHGTCGDNRCLCSPGRYGPNCEMNDPCRRIETDTSNRGFPGFEKSSAYQVLSFDNGTDVELYERPVYVGDVGGASGGNAASFDVVLFVGRRWIATKSRSHELLGETITREELAKYFSLSFHGHFSNYTVDFISEPADAGTLVGNTPSPVGLGWYHPKSFDNRQVDLSRPIEAKLLCSHCDDVDYPCYNGGYCRITGNDKYGECSCPPGTYGVLCQVRPPCSRVSAEFGLELGETLSSLSGTYVLSGGVAYGDRPAYALENPANTPAVATFAYCPVDKAWSFTVGAFRNASDELAPCWEWTAKSGPTATYDISSLSSWVTIGSGNGTAGGDLIPLKFFKLSCLPDEIAVRA